MRCPTDNATLLMSERHGVEIDYCPECRGVWLDRGELDKILEQVGATASPAVPASKDQRSFERGERDTRDYRSSDSKYRKKSSPFEFLGDIFGG